MAERWEIERDQLAADQRSTEELVRTAMAELQLDQEAFDAATDAFGVLLWRSGPELLARSLELISSSDWMERELGVELLGQVHDPAFREVNIAEAWVSMPEVIHGYPNQTLAALIPLVETETNRDVTESLAWAFGHRSDPRGIPSLTRLARHQERDIRFAATRSLGDCSVHARDDAPAHERAAAAEVARSIADPLVVLAEDEDGDIRDWALFGLMQLGLDTPEIRDTFAAHLDDPHRDAMHEAFTGIAKLGDERGLEPLRKLLEGGESSRLILEACEAYADPRFLPGLQTFRDDDYDDDNDELDRVITACSAASATSPGQRR